MAWCRMVCCSSSVVHCAMCGAVLRVACGVVYGVLPFCCGVAACCGRHGVMRCCVVWRGVGAAGVSEVGVGC